MEKVEHQDPESTDSRSDPYTMTSLKPIKVGVAKPTEPALGDLFEAGRVRRDPTKKMLVQIQGIVNEAEKSRIVVRLRKAREKIRQETGKCEGPRHYGYDPARPEEAQVLKDVRYMRRRRKYDGRRRTFQSIADELNEKGITTRQGKPWNPALVFNILKKGKK